MKEALGAERWKIRPSLMFELSLKAGASWNAMDEEG